MLRFLSKILFYLSSFSILPPPRQRQNQILKRISQKFNEKSLFVQNSLRQYECHKHYFLKAHWVIFNLASLLVILPIMTFLLLRPVAKRKSRKISDISLYPGMPGHLVRHHGLVFVHKPLGYIKFRDIRFCLIILKESGLRPYFILRTIWKIAIYSELIDTYRPERFWVTQEMVFESSILTNYLKAFNIEHINFMHGDNYFSIQVAYCSFSRFYIWDEFYKDLFSSLFANVAEYIVFPVFECTPADYYQRKVIKYYNQEISSFEDFNVVLNNLESFAASRGCEVVVRLHPLHKKDEEINILQMRGIEIEPNSVDLVKSLCESEYVCSEFSSVLYQASFLKKKIVIDNSFPERFEIIKDLDVIFLKKLQHEYLVNSAETSHI